MTGFKLIISGALCLTAEKIGQSSPYYLLLLIELQHKFVYYLHTLTTKHLRLSHNFSVIPPPTQGIMTDNSFGLLSVVL